MAASTSESGVECRGLTKDFGRRRVLDDVGFAAPMGAVTGFVGVNGAGKTTTMRILLGLASATSGEALIAGRRYRELRHPRTVVGAALDEIGAHPGQTGRAFLKVLAAAAGVPDKRVGQVLEQVDLARDAGRRVGGYSLGMRRRLALAGALLGDPRILILDEPTNGLDPLGIRWVRELLRDLAKEGRCVLVSSHQLDELEATADRIVMIHKGRLLADMSGAAAEGAAAAVLVRTPQPDALAALVTEAGGTSAPGREQELTVSGLGAERIGELAAGAGIVLHSLTESRSRLEEIFMSLSGADRTETADGGAA